MAKHFTIIQPIDSDRIFTYIALNRAFAFAKVHGQKKAIVETEKLKLTESNYYHELLGYLYADINIDKSINHYKKAIKLTKSKTEKLTLTKEIKRLNKRKNGR